MSIMHTIYKIDLAEKFLELIVFTGQGTFKRPCGELFECIISTLAASIYLAPKYLNPQN